MRMLDEIYMSGVVAGLNMAIVVVSEDVTAVNKIAAKKYDVLLEGDGEE